MNTKNLLENILKISQNNAKNLGPVPMLIGRHGEGKTSLVKKLASDMKKSLVILNLSAIESSDFSGLPSIQDGKTVYNKPHFLDCDILFLDEINRVRDRQVMSCLLSLLVDRKINENSLKKDCLIFCAGNSENEKYDVIEFDQALESRLVKFEFSYSVDEKLEYLSSINKDSQFLRFLKVKNEVFEQVDSRRLASFMQVESPELTVNYFGKEIARLYNHFLESNLVTINDVMKGLYDMKNLSSMTRASLITDVVTMFFELDKKPLEQVKNLNTFLNDLREEEKASYFSSLKKLCLKDHEIFKKQAMALNDLKFFDKQKEYLKELI